MTDMTYKTYTSYSSSSAIPPHGGYRKLRSYQSALIIYDLTVTFCDRYIEKKSRTHDQMVQAARSGCQNIAEGSQVSGTSKKSELKLLGVARGSLEELLNDYESFLRQRGFPLWSKDHPKVRAIRALVYKSDTTYKTYQAYLSSPEISANMLICLIHQASYLLDRQIHSLEELFLRDGGFTERLYKARSERKNR